MSTTGPHRTRSAPSALRRWGRRALAPRHRALHGGSAALTFDDGPSTHTPAVLDVLARHEVVGTFFLVGRNAERRPDLVHRIAAEGHGLASHSYSHPEPRALGPGAWYREVRDGRRAVEEVAGRPVPLFRPPHGDMGRLGSAVARLAGVSTWLWTHDPADWEPDLSPAEVLERLRPLAAGDVTVLHDGVQQPVLPSAEDRSAMVAGLDRFLARARATGLTFTTLEHLGTPPPGTRRPQEPVA